MSTPMEPEFMDPPPPGSNAYDAEWEHAISVLIENTGRWARILIGDYKAVARLTGRIRNSRGGWSGHKWEAATRNTGKSDIHVYARHVGPLSTPEPAIEQKEECET